MDDATDIGTAQFMVRNGPSAAFRLEINAQIASLEYPLGRLYIKDRDGNDVNLRLNAVAQWVQNNMLCGVEEIKVINLDSNLSSSK